MKHLGIAFAALWICQDPAPPRLVVGDFTEKSWSFSGSAPVEDEAELRISARRLERQWDTFRRVFIETKTDKSLLRTLVEVRGRSFSGSLKAGPVGRYAVGLATEEKEILSETFGFGNVEALFEREPDNVKNILETADKAGKLLDELEKILRRQVDVSEQTRDEFYKRVGNGVKALDDAYQSSDLTASIHLVRRAYLHLQGARIWDDRNPPAGSQNDPAAATDVFSDKDVTIGTLRKLLASLAEVISLEIKVSTSLLMDRLLGQAEGVERLLDAARKAARAASKHAEGAPVTDRALVSLLDLAADRKTDPADIREQLRQAGQALLHK